MHMTFETAMGIIIALLPVTQRGVKRPKGQDLNGTWKTDPSAVLPPTSQVQVARSCCRDVVQFSLQACRMSVVVSAE